MKPTLAILAILLAACHTNGKAYTCAEMLGPHPEDAIAILPHGWSIELVVTPGGSRLMGLTNPRGKMVCPVQAEDVPR